MSDKAIPLARESVKISKRVRKAGTVTIRKLVHEQIEPVEIDLADGTVEVQRVPMDRFVDGPVADRVEGDTLIVPVVKEVVVVEKRLKLVEEIHITRKWAVRRYREDVVVRSEDVKIERPETPKS